jgi:hypothetical protein
MSSTIEGTGNETGSAEGGFIQNVPKLQVIDSNNTNASEIPNLASSSADLHDNGKDIPQPSQITNIKPDTSDRPLASNSWAYAITDPYFTSTHHSVKGAGYIDGEPPDRRSLYSEQRFKEMNPGCVILEKGPYSKGELDILHENYRREGATRDALEFESQMILGRRTDLIMSPNRAFADEKREQEEIARLNRDPESLELLDELAQIDIDVGLNEHMHELLHSQNQFGRAVQVIIRDEDGIPTQIVPLASVKLGKVYLSYDWRFLGVEYKDYQGDRRILRAEDIIHMEHNDYHISPNMRFFGLSKMEPVMYIAESLRVSNEIAAPEIHKQMWAPTRDVYVPDAKDEATLNQVAADQLPGKTWTRNYPAEVKVIKPEVDLKAFEESIEFRTKRIYRCAGVPLIKSFQDEQNRSTAQAAIAIYEATSGVRQRTKLRNVMEPQWYIPNLRALIRRKQKRREFGELAPFANEGLVNNLERTATERPRANPSKTSDLRFIPKMEFLPIEIDTFLERTASAIEWVKAGVLTGPEGLEVARLDRYKDAAMARENEKRRALEIFDAQYQEENNMMQNRPSDETSIRNPNASLPSMNRGLSDIGALPPRSKRLPRGGSYISPAEEMEQQLRIELLKKKIKATDDFTQAVNALKRAA